MGELTLMMTDPNSHQTSLWRRSVSESDVDQMITISLRNNTRRFIPIGRSGSKPNIFGLGSCTIGSRHSQLRRLSLGSGATDIMRRFEEMKLEINEWRISAESQLISMKVMNERAEILSRMSLKLTDEAMESGTFITVTFGNDLSCNRFPSENSLACCCISPAPPEPSSFSSLCPGGVITSFILLGTPAI